MTVCAVGTTHPLAFAGLAFSMLALAADGVRPVCVVAGVSAQDAERVRAREAVSPHAIAEQFASLRDAGVAAFHVGALVSAEAVRAVADGVARYPGVPVVVDPVLAASGGDALAGPAAVEALRERLLPRATVVTPNLAEAAALLEMRVVDAATMEDAALRLVALGAHAALVKGGHLAGEAVDVLAAGGTLRRYGATRLPHSLRGTGDLLAATLAAELARGSALETAVVRARERVRRAIAAGVPFAGSRVAPLPFG